MCQRRSIISTNLTYRTIIIRRAEVILTVDQFHHHLKVKHLIVTQPAIFQNLNLHKAHKTKEQGQRTISSLSM